MTITNGPKVPRIHTPVAPSYPVPPQPPAPTPRPAYTPPTPQRQGDPVPYIKP